MSFNAREPQTFINIKLTDIGRRMLSLGQLTFNQAVAATPLDRYQQLIDPHTLASQGAASAGMGVAR